MVKVNNSPTLGRLSRRSLAATRGRNLIAAAAIALTALLFTGLFTVGMSVVDFMQQQTMRQVGTSNHGGFKFLSKEQYDTLTADPKIRDLGYSVVVGLGENPQLTKLYTEIRYADEAYAKTGFMMPTTGRLPQEKNEVACSTQILDALGVPHTLGAPVTLNFTNATGVHNETFTLSGFWQGDAAGMAQTALLSKAYAEAVAPMPTVPYSQQSDPNLVYGYYNAGFNFASSWDIEGQMAQLKARCGFGPEVNDGVNWAYGASSVDGTTILLVGAFLALILFSGYLIIYNVFALSVARDIRFYGLLKTIGTTPRQLRRLVRRQALLLSGIGIPVGLVLGWLCGKGLLPVIMATTSYPQSGVGAQASLNPLVFVGGAAFTLLTVFISCIRPCNIAGRVSPMEALRYTEGQKAGGKSVKRTGGVNPRAMAFANLRRTPGKTAVVVASLTLSLVLLNSVYTLTQGFDMDEYVKSSVVTDFILTDASILNVGSSYQENQAITPQVMQELEQMPGITSQGQIYYTLQRHAVRTESAKEKVEQDIAYTAEHFGEQFAQSSGQQYHDTGEVWSAIYGLDAFPAGLVEVYRGSFDAQKFAAGGYVLVQPQHRLDSPDETADSAYYQPGEKVTLAWPDGTEATYEVMAVAELPYALGAHSTLALGCEFLLPAQEVSAHGQLNGAMSVCMDVADDQQEAAQQWMTDYTDASINLDSESKATYVEEFQAMSNMFTGVGGALALILGLIGILNFVNASITSILARRRELAMLQGVGMTGRQLNTMLVWEGAAYVLFTLGITATLGSALCWGLVQLLGSQLGFFTYHFTLLPVALCAPLMLALAALVPLAAYKVMCKDSVVDRMRAAE